jgi:MFS superfamily sulfate permease-like transporter
LTKQDIRYLIGFVPTVGYIRIRDGQPFTYLSMRAVPMIDLSGLEVLATLYEKMVHEDKVLILTGLQPAVLQMLERAKLVDAIGRDNFFWSSDRAIYVAEQPYICPHCSPPELAAMSVTASEILETD